MLTEFPSGTVTFLFTDIEGSMQLAQRVPQHLPTALARHDAILRAAIARHHGFVLKTIGDAFQAAFDTAPDAVAAALDAQRALQAEPWRETGPLRVRMGMHTGTAEWRAGEYDGYLTLSRAQRVMAAGHGGQVLLSGATESLVRDNLPDGASLRGLGEHRLKSLVRPEALFQLIAPDLPGDFPPLNTLDVRPHNLPTQMTSFIGRDKELAAVRQLLAEARLLTLVGMGGSGKTRLSLQVAADALEQFPDGVWFIELAPLADPAFLVHAITSVVSVREEAGRPLLHTLGDYWSAKTVLLILDNCEHMIEAAARVADFLLRRCAQLKIMASSRELLGIAGERTFQVPPLSMPNPRRLPPLTSLANVEAVQLFVERAKAVQPSFALNMQNASAIAQLCYQLDGNPLAIELAAARVGGVPVEQIAARLDDRFRLLTGGSRTALPRQQTLRALIDWSYELLGDDERVLLRRLAVFVGGCTLAAAERVCADTEQVQSGEVLDLLTRLVEKSLVVPEPIEYESGTEVAETRYRMLETIRLYAREKLQQSDEQERLRELHLAYYLSLADESEVMLIGTEQLPWLNRLEHEHDNLRAALQFALQHAVPEMSLRLASALARFWLTRGFFSEGREWQERALARTTADHLLRARALTAVSSLAYRQNELAHARAYAEQALSLYRAARDELGIAAALNILGDVAFSQADIEAARDLYQESLALHRARNHKMGIATVLANLGNVAWAQSDYDLTRSLYDESLAMCRELGDMHGMAQSLASLGTLAQTQGDYESARTLHEVALSVQLQLGNKAGIAASRARLGEVAAQLGETDSARASLEESLALYRALGAKGETAGVLSSLGALAARTGDEPLARALLAQSLSLAREANFKPAISQALVQWGRVEAAAGEPERARAYFTESLEIWRDFGYKPNIAELLYELGCLALQGSELAESRAYLLESLRLASALDNARYIHGTLLGLARWLAAVGADAQAVRLLGALDTLRAQAGVAAADRQTVMQREVELLRKNLPPTAFDAEWAAGHWLSLAQAVALAQSAVESASPSSARAQPDAAP